MKAKSGSGGAAHTPKGVQAFRKMRKAVDSTLKNKPSYSKSRPTADTSERKTSAGISAYKKRQGAEGPKRSTPVKKPMKRGK